MKHAPWIILGFWLLTAGTAVALATRTVVKLGDTLTIAIEHRPTTDVIRFQDNDNTCYFLRNRAAISCVRD